MRRVLPCVSQQTIFRIVVEKVGFVAFIPELTQVSLKDVSRHLRVNICSAGPPHKLHCKASGFPRLRGGWARVFIVIVIHKTTPLSRRAWGTLPQASS